jgi:D-alanyl-D-alanine carboxypeptidase
MARLLADTWHDLRILPALLGSLPGPGEDGTLRKRFDGGAPRLRAKTGTMNEPPASGLAGYLQGEGSGPIAFAILMNAPPGSAWTVPRMQSLQEEWVRLYTRPAAP